jgi:UDP-N-acetylglucosamine 2-epimerase (non-hydrolysing)
VPGWKAAGRRLVLVTAHRRENLGKPLENICEAIRELHDQFNDLVFIYPVHLNPVIQETAHRILNDLPRVHLIDPIDVEDMHNLMSQCYLVMTDSGGLQEEAPAFGVPVLVLRTETERPEAVEAGTVVVVGVEKSKIVEEAVSLLTNKERYAGMSKAINPYGDGTASRKIVEYLVQL